jgi:head-tail adaptor
MAPSDLLDQHRSRCGQELMQLRILARAPSLPGEASAEIRDATNAIIAEVEAMSRTALRAAGRQDAQAETFLWVRIARLAAAADRAVDAARNRDIAGLRGHLHQFDRLTSAIWAVQHATYGT